MNLSLQLARGLGTLALCAAVSAYAISTTVAPVVPDITPATKEVPVAHSRVTIETVRGSDNRAHYQVAGVRVGNPVAVAKNGERVSRVDAARKTPLRLVADIRSAE